MNNGVKLSKGKTYYMPTVYVDQDGVIYNHQQIKEYKYKREGSIRRTEQLYDQKRIHTIVRIQIYRRAAKQLRLF